MSLLHLCEWLANTRWSIALHESFWAYPVIESVHVLALRLFVGMATALDLADETRLNPVWSKVVALVSLSLWTGVGIGGRWIGFS